MEETWELAVVSEGGNTDALRKLHKRSKALITAMDSARGSDTPNHGKWQSSINFIFAYNGIAEGYHHYAEVIFPSPDAVKIYDTSQLKSSGSYTWPTMKQLFDSAYMDALTLEAMLSDFSTPTVSELSEMEDFLSQRLRKAFTSIPTGEIEVQDKIETMFIGRGMEKPGDYDRETGRTKSSGKEDIPDFVLKVSNTALEVKLIKTKNGKRDIIEQMRADVQAYKVSYTQVLFVVYDLGHIRDVSEFSTGFSSTPGVRVVVVKH